MAEMLEHVGDLRWSDARQGKRRETILSEELGVGGFVTILRRAATNFREEEKFVGMEDVGRMAVKVAVKDGSEFGDADFVAGFFASLACSSSAGSFADVSPTAGKCPEPVLKFANEQDAVIAKGGDANIDLGSGVTGLLREEVEDRGRAGDGGSGGGHLGSDVADFVVALNVELVLTIGETRLGDGLEAARPSEPLGSGHGVILAHKGLQPTAHSSRGSIVVTRWLRERPELPWP
jgi:hypothetical protein